MAWSFEVEYYLIYHLNFFCNYYFIYLVLALLKYSLCLFNYCLLFSMIVFSSEFHYTNIIHLTFSFCKFLSYLKRLLFCLYFFLLKSLNLHIGFSNKMVLILISIINQDLDIFLTILNPNLLMNHCYLMLI